ncbi:MAG TPA: pyridoxamine 5'-phosphate oxidase family protein [Acidimicrobiales bacterium]|nr:pyridoxamine 5'-phosphate oxidase family protein [Acidimicrobiales bacterium]
MARPVAGECPGQPATPDPGAGEILDERGSEVLSAADCHRLLARAAGGVGRLGFSLEGRITVLPLNFACYAGDIMLRLGTGRMLEALVGKPVVGFEVDYVDAVDSPAPEAWSVLVHGTAEVVRDVLELGEASALGLTPLVAEPGQVYVRVRVEHISGRRFPVGALARFRIRS